MREAILWEKLGDSRVRCDVCPRRCVMRDGQSGVCRVRVNDKGTLRLLVYDVVSSIAADPIEKKPLYHFHPASTVLSVGTLGCNMHCAHCQNWQIAHWDGKTDLTGALHHLPPDELVRVAVDRGAQGLAWTYNEPTIWLEYTIDGARLARQNGLYTVYVTNGYITPEALDEIGPYLDAYRVDVKGWNPEFYRKLAKVADPSPILEAAARAQEKWGCHVEVITNVIPTYNDDDGQLECIARWIAGRLGPETPWHVTRFVPHLDLSHLPSTPVKTLERAREIGRRAGLRYVYIGNVPGHAAENTYCPSCSGLVIKRAGFGVSRVRLQDGACPDCGTNIPIRGEVKIGIRDQGSGVRE